MLEEKAIVQEIVRTVRRYPSTVTLYLYELQPYGDILLTVLAHIKEIIRKLTNHRIRINDVNVYIDYNNVDIYKFKNLLLVIRLNGNKPLVGTTLYKKQEQLLLKLKGSLANKKFIENAAPQIIEETNKKVEYLREQQEFAYIHKYLLAIGNTLFKMIWCLGSIDNLRMHIQYLRERNEDKLDIEKYSEGWIDYIYSKDIDWIEFLELTGIHPRLQNIWISEVNTEKIKANLTWNRRTGTYMYIVTNIYLQESGKLHEQEVLYLNSTYEKVREKCVLQLDNEKVVGTLLRVFLREGSVTEKRLIRKFYNYKFIKKLKENGYI